MSNRHHQRSQNQSHSCHAGQPSSPNYSRRSILDSQVILSRLRQIDSPQQAIYPDHRSRLGQVIIGGGCLPTRIPDFAQNQPARLRERRFDFYRTRPRHKGVGRMRLLRTRRRLRSSRGARRSRPPGATRSGSGGCSGCWIARRSRCPSSGRPDREPADSQRIPGCSPDTPPACRRLRRGLGDAGSRRSMVSAPSRTAIQSPPGRTLAEGPGPAVRPPAQETRR